MDPASKIVVIKIGTSSLLRSDLSSINLSSLARVCETVKELRNMGHKVVLVSSGAIGVGCQKMGLPTRPTALAQRQAVAAVGQIHLMRYYQEFFQALGLTCAQVLLTLNNLSDRGPYLNARNTFQELLAYDTIPIVNENDTIAVEEIRFGDNDTLSAQVATLVKADWLFLLTDVDSLYTANPATHPKAVRIPEVHDITKLQVDTSTSSDLQWGTGGMTTKLTAARIATAAACSCLICSSSSSQTEAIPSIVAGKRHQAGTLFHPLPNAVRDRKRWILSVPVKGELWLDGGALAAVREHSKSLFAAGIVNIQGAFAAQDAVVLCDANGYEFARGLCNYTHQELLKVQGKSSRTFKDELGYIGSEEIIHRNNICLLSIVSSLSAGPNQDGTPDPTPDEPSPTKAPPPAYASMSNQAGIPGLSNQAWPSHEQQNSGYHQDSYPPGSHPMQSPAGNTGAQPGFGANPEAYWQQQQQQHYGGSSQARSQAPGLLGVAAPHKGPQGGAAPGQTHHHTDYQQEWHGVPGGSTPQGVVKQEPSLQPPFGAQPHRHPTLSSSSAPDPSYASSSLPFGVEGTFPSGDHHHMVYDPLPPSSGLVPPGTSLPPHSSFPPAPTSTRMGHSDLPHQPPQQGHPGVPNQATGPPSSQAYASGYPQRDSKTAPAGDRGRLKAHGGPPHKKRQFEAGPPRNSGNQRQTNYASGGHGRQSRQAGGVQDRMRQLQSRGQIHEQGTDGVMHGGSGTYVAGFTPSADPAWRDADFRERSQAGAPPTGYGYSSGQPDVNEQGWLPR